MSPPINNFLGYLSLMFNDDTKFCYNNDFYTRNEMIEEIKVGSGVGNEMRDLLFASSLHRKMFSEYNGKLVCKIDDLFFGIPRKMRDEFKKKYIISKTIDYFDKH